MQPDMSSHSGWDLSVLGDFFEDIQLALLERANHPWHYSRVSEPIIE